MSITAAAKTDDWRNLSREKIALDTWARNASSRRKSQPNPANHVPPLCAMRTRQKTRLAGGYSDRKRIMKTKFKTKKTPKTSKPITAMQLRDLKSRKDPKAGGRGTQEQHWK